jgi:hypothetical protein
VVSDHHVQRRDLTELVNLRDTMNDLATLNGRGRPLSVDGATYLLYPLTIADLGELQAWVEAQWPDPLLKVRERLDEFPPALQRELVREAAALAARPKPRIGTPEADALVFSAAGWQEIAYLSIRKGRPDFTREQAARLCARLTEGELARVYSQTGVELVLSDPKGSGPVETEATPTPASTPIPT